MKVGIIGTRGIPNHYGGFEQFLEGFAQFLVSQGIDTTVYNSSLHPFEGENYNGVSIVKCYDPEDKIGTPGQFIYDLNCILDAKKKNFDIILQLGYTSSGIWNFLLPENAKIITNIDGLEWKRAKYNFITKKFLKYSEKLAINRSDVIICDSKGIQSYLNRAHQLEGKFIAYAATIPSNYDEKVLQEFNLEKNKYSVVIARMEPENNIELILNAYAKSNINEPLIVIGAYQNTKHGKKWKNDFKDNSKIRFLGSIYDLEKLNSLRYFSKYYFHGHSVGGTNPSLLEAMANESNIIAHSNEFNESVLGDKGLYFTDEENLTEILNNELKPDTDGMLEIIKNDYSPEKIHQQYLDTFIKCLEK